MSPFIEYALEWATLSGRHVLLMFWWIWVSAVVLTAVAEAVLEAPVRRRLVEAVGPGWHATVLAIVLGVLSPPSRSLIFRQARELLADGVSPHAVMTYLFSAQTLLIWLLFLIVALDGPQPAIGQFLAAGVALAVLAWGVGRVPASAWEAARGEASRREGGRDAPSQPPTRPLPLRLGRSVAGQAYSLWWPMVVGLAGVGILLALALGQYDAYVSLQGSRGPVVQLGNAVVGLLFAFVSGAPLVGNALIAAGLWKADWVTYAGLSAFLLGTTVNPFVLPRYYSLLGADVAKRLLIWMGLGILSGALVATAWWWGLDWLAGTVGLRDWFEAFSHSTLRPNAVPWFHHWFQVKGM
jgi:uncharacterized membrane protein YraQ (UPF0718 family)